MHSRFARKRRRNSQSGISMIELLIAGMILVISSLGIMVLISTAIATNSRNKIDSTKSMLAGAVLEQIDSTIIGSGTAPLSDCAGNSFTINTAPGGAALSGSGIDFTESSPPANYHMDYVVNSPCDSTGKLQATYDVRWNIQVLSSTNTYLITVGARLKGISTSNLYFSIPTNVRVMLGN